MLENRKRIGRACAGMGFAPAFPLSDPVCARLYRSKMKARKEKTVSAKAVSMALDELFNGFRVEKPKVEKPRVPTVEENLMTAIRYKLESERHPKGRLVAAFLALRA